MPLTSVRTTPESVSSDLPAAMVLNLIVARTPSPLAPVPPAEEHLNVRLPATAVSALRSGAEQATLRSVEPKKRPLLMLRNARWVLSQVNVNWYEASSVVSTASTPIETVS